MIPSCERGITAGRVRFKMKSREKDTVHTQYEFANCGDGSADVACGTAQADGSVTVWPTVKRAVP